jgi:3-hydroxybutyryl-CoA dehydrogenase
MATGIIEVFAKAGYAVTFVARGRTRSPGCTPPWRAARRDDRARPPDRRRTPTRSTDGSPAPPTARRSGTSTSSSRRSPRTSRSSRSSSATSTDLQAGCHPRDDDVLAADHRLRQGDLASGDVIGMHFFNPAQVMKLVEVVHTVRPTRRDRRRCRTCAPRSARWPVTCGDRSGFIVNALLFPYLNDAVKMLEANYATADDIDTAMKAGCGLPMGPVRAARRRRARRVPGHPAELYLEFREPGFAPAPLLEHLVTAGYLGRKSKRGLPHLRLSQSRRHRGRGHRHLDRLSPGPPRLDRCRRARTRPADLRHDLARGRPDDLLRLHVETEHRDPALRP